MAPEQAAGDPATDHRADLYALGVVAYEALTGAPPFAGRTPQALMAAHAVRVPEPVRDRRPAVPLALAALVMRCLEKHPADRPSSAAELVRALDAVQDALGSELGAPTPVTEASTAPATARPTARPAAPPRERPPGPQRARWLVGAGAVAGAGLLAALGVSVRARSAPPVDPGRVAVATVENRTGDRALDAVAAQAAEFLTQGVGGIDGVTAVDRRAVVDAEAGRAGAGEGAAVGRATGAGVVVGGSYYASGRDSLTFQLQLTDARTGATLAALDPVTASRAAPVAGLGVARERVLGGIAVLTDRRLGRLEVAGRQPPLLGAYRQVTAGWDAQGQHPQAAITHFERAAALDTTFLLPRVLLMVAYQADPRGGDAVGGRGDSLRRVLDGVRDRLTPYERALLDVSSAAIRGDLVGRVDALRRAVALDSTTSFATSLAWALRDLNRPREALVLYDRHWAALPATQRTTPSAAYWLFHTQVYHVLGRHAEELAAARAGRHAHPDDRDLLRAEVVALVALDSVPTVRARLAEIANLPVDPADPCGCTAPGALSADVAHELRAHGHPDEARTAFAETLRWYRTRQPSEARRAHARLGRIEALYALGAYAAVRAAADSLPQAEPDGLLTLLDVRVQAATYRGASLARLGDTAGARRADADLVRLAGTPAATAHGDWRVADIIMNRARIAAALGHRDAAVTLIQDALAHGANWFWRASLHSTPDFASLRGYLPFDDLLQPRG